MKRYASALTLCLLLLCACDSRDEPPLSLSAVRILEPLPGGGPAAGYLTIENHQDRPLVLNAVSSPQFERVQIHVTAIEDDVARMQRLDELAIDARQAFELAPGGTHLMLIAPRHPLNAGDRITLQFDFDDHGLLIIDTTIVARRTVEGS